MAKMNDGRNNTGVPGGVNDERSETTDMASLIRLAADGELTAAEEQALQRLKETDGSIEGRIAFERSLKQACSKAMAGPSCPDALRAKIEAMAASSRADRVAGTIDGEPESGVEDMAPMTRDRSFWSGGAQRAGMALAASLLIAMSAVFVWQSVRFGNSNQNLGHVQGGLVEASFRTDLAQLMTSEHERITSSESAATRKMTMTSADEAVSWFREHLGQTVQLPALDQPVESIEFAGAGRCGFPSSKGDGAHMQFNVQLESGESAKVSVFTGPRTESAPMVEGMTYAIDTTACGIEGFTMVAWTDGLANYYMVSDAEDDACPKEVLEQVGQPEATVSF